MVLVWFGFGLTRCSYTRRFDFLAVEYAVAAWRPDGVAYAFFVGVYALSAPFFVFFDRFEFCGCCGGWDETGWR